MARRVVRWRGLGVISVLALASCGGDAGGGAAAEVAPVLRVDLLDEAIAAVEDERGGPQDFFEVNATPALVNLFVAVDGATATVPYVYLADDGLQEPLEQQEASGPTFVGGDVAVDADTVLDQVLAELPESVPELFVVSAAASGGVEYRVLLRSELGGQLSVIVTGDGAIVGTDALSS